VFDPLLPGVVVDDGDGADAGVEREDGAGAARAELDSDARPEALELVP
jgi:hypothetical protein